MSKSKQSKLKYQIDHHIIKDYDELISKLGKKNNTLTKNYKGIPGFGTWKTILSIGERGFNSDRNKRIKRALKKRVRSRMKHEKINLD